MATMLFVGEKSHQLLMISLAIVVALALTTPGSSSLHVKRSHPSVLHTTAKTNQLIYHGGPLLTKPGTINVYLIWYGRNSQKDKATITDFFSSFTPTNDHSISRIQRPPTVSKWWKTIQSYKDKAGSSVPGAVRLIKQISNDYSLGKNIKRAQIADLVQNKIDNNLLPVDPNGIYLVLTSRDVTVERFCMSSCGFHDTKTVPAKGNQVVVGHVGDPSLQCPGFCAWPYAVPAYGPPFKPLVSPNGVGADGLVINIATILAGAATNPFRDGYYQGHVEAPLEAVTACQGKFGEGAFPGFPGKLLEDRASNASYNAYGANGRKFLLPAMWDPVSFSCKVVT
ncbi:hypothetical protein TIFTF001_021531 [Ficus carica]|uniref:Uncharacterized protein n=1 Tax=Ficus carica TaxID=3494 RepID=A0AA88DDQ2_FICCA|nr:hypothetical protein TIFTF001_021531 [Ficus carica]